MNKIVKDSALLGLTFCQGESFCQHSELVGLIEYIPKVIFIFVCYVSLNLLSGSHYSPYFCMNTLAVYDLSCHFQVINYFSHQNLNLAYMFFPSLSESL